MITPIVEHLFINIANMKRLGPNHEFCSPLLRVLYVPSPSHSDRENESADEREDSVEKEDGMVEGVERDEEAGDEDGGEEDGEDEDEDEEEDKDSSSSDSDDEDEAGKPVELFFPSEVICAIFSYQRDLVTLVKTCF